MILPVTSLGPPLAPVPRLGELIKDRLLGLMQSGHLREGSKLPSERELAEILGVSRTMVREALSALQLAGLVERRPGVGTVIVRVPASGLDLDLEDHLEASASIAELIEARMAVDLGIAHLLCDNRRYDLTEAASCFDAMTLAVKTDGNPTAYLDASLQFHRALARATERTLLVDIHERLVDLMRPHVWLLAEQYDISLAGSSLELHHRILDAFSERDLVTSLALVRSHYSPYPILGRSLSNAAATRRRHRT
jgi:DNA-binding FadR family transcriptional regulator